MFTKADYENLKTPRAEQLNELIDGITDVLTVLHSDEENTHTCRICDMRHVINQSPLIADVVAKSLSAVLINGDVEKIKAVLAMMFVLGQLFQLDQTGTFDEVKVLERMFKNSTEKS